MQSTLERFEVPRDFVLDFYVSNSSFRAIVVRWDIGVEQKGEYVVFVFDHPSAESCQFFKLDEIVNNHKIKENSSLLG